MEKSENYFFFLGGGGGGELLQPWVSKLLEAFG